MRERLPLSGPWRFQPDLYCDGETVGYFRPTYDDARWRAVEVPCTLQAGMPDLLPVESAGWYRRRVAVPASWRGRHVVLRFEGASYHARAWVNGREVGGHEDGFLPFELPVHDALAFGADNLVAVRVDNERRPGEVPGRQEGWRPFGGLLREVELLARHPVYVEHVRITAEPTGEGGRVALRATIVNRSGEAFAGRLAVAFGTAGGPRLAEAPAQAVSVPVHGAAEIELAHDLPGAEPWSPEHPALYAATVRLLAEAGDELDAVTERFGFRTIRVDGERLLLNGRPVYLTGFNRHEDSVPADMCTDLRTTREDLERIRAAGGNFVRLCHYPHHPAELAMCDELGLLAMDEIPLWQWPGLEEGEEACAAKLDAARRQLEAMIRRDVNHPSIILWSVSNETREEKPEVAEGNRQLLRLARRLDPTRPVTHVSCFWQSFFRGNFDEDDVLCVNWYPSLERNVAEDPWGPTGRTRGAPADLDGAPGAEAWRKELADLHRRCPGRPILVSEFGYPCLPGVFDAGVGEEVQARAIEAEFAAFDAPYVCGATIWCLSDHAWPLQAWMKRLSISPFGVLARDRTPKQGFAVASRLFRRRRGLEAESGA